MLRWEVISPNLSSLYFILLLNWVSQWKIYSFSIHTNLCLVAFSCLTPLLSPGGKSRTNWRLRSVKLESSDAFDTSHPHFVLFPPHLRVSRREDWRQLPEACQKGAFLLLAGVSGGCVRDRSFPHPGVVAFPRLPTLRKPERKERWRWIGCTTVLPCPLSHPGDKVDRRC